MFSSHSTTLTVYLPSLLSFPMAMMENVSPFFSLNGDNSNAKENEQKTHLFIWVHSRMCKTGGARERKCTVCSRREQKTGEIIQDNENAFDFRGQTVFITSHNHSWLPFNAGLTVFMDRKLLVSKQWKVLVLQVVGEVTTAHWCIVCFIAASWRSQKMYSLSLSPIRPLDRQEHWVVIQCHTNLKGPIPEHTHKQLKLMASSVSYFHHSLSGYLLLQATRQTPVGILALLPTPAGRQETSKCGARCALPAQWDIHCMARQRGSASPMGPGRADSHSANVREMCLWCCVWNSQRGILDANIEGLALFTYSWNRYSIF